MVEYAPLSVNQWTYLQAARNAWLNVAEGGKRAGKNVLNILAWSLSLENHPDRIHLAAGVSIGTAKMNILDSNGYGLRGFFENRCRAGRYMDKEALYIHTVDGQEKIVIFAGGAKANDAALIKGNTYGSVYVTEANECHQTFIQEVLDRTISSSRRELFMDLNPKAPRHWFYADFLDFQDRLKADGHNDRYNYGHFTIADNLSMSDEQVREVVSKYNRDSLWYRADILGQRTSASGRIYTSYDEAVVSISREEILRRDYFELAVGIDVGGTDATAVTLAGLTADRREVILMDGLYHRQGINDRMSESDYIAVIIRFLKKWVNWKPYPGVVWVDSANKLFRTGLAHEMERQGMNRFVVRAFDKQDGINSRIELNEMLMTQGRFRVAEHLKQWHEAYQMAVWDENAYEKSSWVRLDDGSYPLDCLDSAEYAFTNFRRYLEDR